MIRQDTQEQIRTGYIQRGPGTPPVSARGEIEAVRPEFQKNMQTVLVSPTERMSQDLPPVWKAEPRGLQ